MEGQALVICLVSVAAAIVLKGRLPEHLRRININPYFLALIMGTLVGPNVLRIIDNREAMAVPAEWGAALLLFITGVELELKEFIRNGKRIVFLGTLQMGLTALFTWGVCTVFAATSPEEAWFAAMLVSVSSTAVVLTLLRERHALERPWGKIIVSILLFQDLMVVPFMLLVPFLAGQGGTDVSIFWPVMKSIGILALMGAAAFFLVPKLLREATHSAGNTGFTVMLAAIILLIAEITHLVGLSPAIGAFLAGLAASESSYSHRALAETLPLKTIFGSVFFFFVGTFFDPMIIVDQPALMLGGVAFVVVGKAFFAFLPPFIAGDPFGRAAFVGAGLAQIGEFSFVLAQEGLNTGLMSDGQYQIFLGISVLSMLLTPLLLKLPERLPSPWYHRKPNLPWVTGDPALASSGSHALSNHVILIGYGVTGRGLGWLLKENGIEYAVIEQNPATVAQLREEGIHAIYGDCTNPIVLEAAGITRAERLFVAISNRASLEPTLILARSLAGPKLDIVVRAEFINGVAELRELGASEVIVQEYLATLAMGGMLLRRIGLTPEQTTKFIEQLRARIQPKQQQEDRQAAA